MARTDVVVVTRRHHPEAVLVHLDDHKIPADRSRRCQPADFAGGGRRPRMSSPSVLRRVSAELIGAAL